MKIKHNQLTSSILTKQQQHKCQTYTKQRNPLNSIQLTINHTLASVAIYLIMIEGLGRGVKYSLFAANAIIFVSVAVP